MVEVESSVGLVEGRTSTLTPGNISDAVQVTSNFLYVVKSSLQTINIVHVGPFSFLVSLIGVEYNFVKLINPTLSLDVTLYGFTDDKILRSLTVSDDSVSTVTSLSMYDPTGLVELQGFNALAISDLAGKILIYKFSDSSLEAFDVSGTSGSITGLCFLTDSAMLGLTQSMDVHKANMYRLEMYCHSSCSK